MNVANASMRETRVIESGSHHTTSRIVTRGGSMLAGKIRIGGAKNAALPMMAAALLTDEPCVLENVPVLEDIFVMVELLRKSARRLTSTRRSTASGSMPGT
jgi:UDP-N-acetylglucosamine enolpyruvyl transferase